MSADGGPDTVVQREVHPRKPDRPVLKAGKRIGSSRPRLVSIGFASVFAFGRLLLGPSLLQVFDRSSYEKNNQDEKKQASGSHAPHAVAHGPTKPHHDVFLPTSVAVPANSIDSTANNVTSHRTRINVTTNVWSIKRSTQVIFGPVD